MRRTSSACERDSSCGKADGMKAAELRELEIEELVRKVREARDDFFNAKVKHATGQLEDTAKLRSLRRDVARVETVLAQMREATK